MSQFSSFKAPSGFYVKNSLDLEEEIYRMNIDNNEELVSFDVTALYPNVPIIMGTRYFGWKSWAFHETNRALYGTIFQCQGKFYRPCFGTSMGNPLSCFITITTLPHYGNQRIFLGSGEGILMMF